MRKHLLLRPFDRYTLCCYFGAVALILFLAEGQNVPTILFQGFSVVNGTGGLDLLSAMLWNLCVLPPVSVSILYIIHEFEVLFFYTVLRSKSILHWWLARFTAIVFLNYAFYCFVQIILTLTRCNHLIPEQTFKIAILFPLHTTLLSTLCCGGAILFSSRGAISLYLLMEGVLVMIGMVYPPISPFLIPYWGMTCATGDFWVSPVLASLVLLLIFNIAVIWYIKKHH